MRSQLYVIGIVGFWILEHVEAVYYLDQADGYSALPSCAEVPISSIVRDMVSGCGDGGRTISYSCFCTASSDRFSNLIATAVAKNCGQSNAEVASATQVFDAYCQLGKTDAATGCYTKINPLLCLDVANITGGKMLVDQLRRQEAVSRCLLQPLLPGNHHLVFLLELSSPSVPAYLSSLSRYSSLPISYGVDAVPI